MQDPHSFGDQTKSKQNLTLSRNSWNLPLVCFINNALKEEKESTDDSFNLRLLLFRIHLPHTT